MQKPQARRIFRDASLLCLASLLMRTAGVSFQVAVSNTAGAEAMGLFSLLGGIYGFALTLATSGIHLGVTRTVADLLALEKSDRVRSSMRSAFLFSSLFGVGASLLLFLSAPPIGNLCLKDARTVPELRLLSLTLPLISLTAAMNGYFVAVRKVWKNAAVQVVEQVVKIPSTFFFLSLFRDSGIGGSCTALVLGGLCGDVSAFLLAFVFYLFDLSRRFPASRSRSGRSGGRALLGITLPIALTTYVRSGLVTLEHLIIPQGLRKSGISHSDALVSYGEVSGMALPVVLFPSAFIYSFAGLLIPEFAACKLRGETKRIGYMTSRTLWLSLLFSIGISGGLICFSAPLGELLFPNTSAAGFIGILAPLIPVMYVDGAVDAMLRGLGEQITVMRINIADAALSVVLVALLTPRFGIYGFIATVYFSEFFNTVASSARLFSVSSVKISLYRWVISPLLSVLGATYCAVFLWDRLFSVSLNKPCALIPAMALTLVFYLLLLRISGGINREDCSWIAGLFGPREDDPAEKRDSKEQLAELDSLSRRGESLSES